MISTRRRSPLLTKCVLAREIWYLVLRRCNLQRHTPSLANSDFVEWWLLSRKQLGKEIRKTFDSLVILVAWSIWKERNQRIFQKVKLTAAELVDFILDEAKVWGFGGIAHFSMLFPWLPEGTEKIIGCSSLRGGRGELGSVKTLTYGSNYFCTKHKLDAQLWFV